MKKLTLIFVCALSISAMAAELIPGYESSGSEKLDKALYRLHQMYHASKCTSKMDSYEYVAPLITEALEEKPELITDYILKLPFNTPINDLHLKNLFEYQLAKVIAYEKVLEEREHREIEFSQLEQLEFSLNDSVFRRIVPGEPIPRDVLMFSYEKKDDGTVEREVRWVSNYLGMYKGEETWLIRKRVFPEWSIEQSKSGEVVVTIDDKENNEILKLVLEKKVAEEGKPAQWALTDEAQDMEFLDYFTGFCDDPANF